MSNCSTSGASGLSASAQLKKFRESLESSFNKKTLLKEGGSNNPSPSGSRPTQQQPAKKPQQMAPKPAAAAKQAVPQSVVRKAIPPKKAPPKPSKQPGVVEVIDLDEDDVICID